MVHGCFGNGCFGKVWQNLLAICLEDAAAADAESQLELMPASSETHVEESGKERKEKSTIVKAGQETTNSFLVKLLKSCFWNQRDAKWGILDEKKDRGFELGYKLSYLLARFLFLVSLKEPKEVITKLVKFGAAVKDLDADYQNSVIVEKITTVLKMTYKELRDRNEPYKLQHHKVMDDQFKLLIEFYGVDRLLDRFMTQLLSLGAVLSSPNSSVPLSLVEPGLNHCEKKLIGLQVVIETLEVYRNCTPGSDNISANLEQKIQFLWGEEQLHPGNEFVSLEIEEEWRKLLDADKKLARNGPEDR